ncbi:MAG: phosphoglucosamine mutase [Acidobacteria bacterium]|nr:phosphoglucosamine mutase [Acidobacteriota bacterium]
MPRELFGTDGIRGVAGQYPLDAATVFAIGRALGELVASLDPSPEVLIGMDTRESGLEIAGHLAAGLAGAGVPARFAGVVTTPAIAHLTQTSHFVAGVMISASHNPYQDNGIKVFAHSGFKLPDEIEEQVEQGIAHHRGAAVRSLPLQPDPRFAEVYIEHLISCLAAPLDSRFRLSVDCANGASFEIAPRLFVRLGVAVDVVGNRPDGRNINLECGSLHPERLRMSVLHAGSHLGVAFDGDADRAIFISGAGREINGDGVLWMAARHLCPPLVVTTTMANLGLEKALDRTGVAVVRTPVGDKYVLEEMLRRDAELGGEQSGHIIFRRHATTGDGLLTALKVLEIMTATGLDLDQLTAALPIYPQTIRNVRVRSRTPLDELPAVREAIHESRQALNSRGRIVVRYSGTEPLVRVMVEAETQEEVETHAERLAQVIQLTIGT